jgi:hypothetical protein
MPARFHVPTAKITVTICFRPEVGPLSQPYFFHLSGLKDRNNLPNHRIQRAGICLEKPGEWYNFLINITRVQ